MSRLRVLPSLNNFGLTPYVNTKFGAYQSIFGNTTNASDWPLMRVEEMYLIKAEAEAMGGNLSGGKSTLENFVRTYRDPSFTSKANSAQDFQDEVWLQRRMELWGEGFSLFDILRLKKPVVRKNTNYDPSVQYNSAAEAQILIYRIPQCEMETNSGSVTLITIRLLHNHNYRDNCNKKEDDVQIVHPLFCYICRELI